MRTAIACALLLYCTLNLKAKDHSPLIKERGPHHRVVQFVKQVTQPDGSTTSHTSTYTEVGNGLNRWTGTQWVDSDDSIRPVPGGAVGEFGPYQVTFAANLNTFGAIDIVSPDDKRFRSHILGLAYTDAASGKSVLIAEPKDSQGTIHGNQAIYRDAFTDLKADVRYTYAKGGFEQDVILREEPPSPAEFGLDPATTRLEIFTEFIEPPAATRSTTVLKATSDPARRQAMVDPDLTDDTLDFGHFKMGLGAAFPLAESPATGEEANVEVGKNWVRIQGRDFLIEKVEYNSVRPHLNKLPKAPPGNPNRQARISEPKGKMLARIFPPPPKALAAVPKPMQTAALTPQAKGFVLDYSLVAVATNFVFRSDTTYLVTSNVFLGGTTVIEAGTVVKFTNSTSVPKLTIQGPIDCQTTPYRPAIFTSKNDNTVGEMIMDSSGQLTNDSYFASVIFVITDTTNSYDLHDLRMSHATQCIVRQTGSTNSAQMKLSNIQITDCNRAFSIYYWPLQMRNMLFHRVRTVLNTPLGFANPAENVTCHDVGALLSPVLGSINFTNSLLVRVTNSSGAGIYSSFVTNDSTGIFETVGAAGHYLPTNSPFRNIGTTNIAPALLADLKKKTTYAPLLLTNVITSNTVWQPQAQRDTDAPDLGYHYDPIDYLGKVVSVSNAVLTLTNGVVVAGGCQSALWVHDNAKLVSVGTPTTFNRILRFNSAQERSTTWDTNSPVGSVLFNGYNYGSTPASLYARFTAFDTIGGVGWVVYNLGGAWSVNPMVLQDCEVFGGGLELTDQVPNSVGFTNNLFYRVCGSVHDYDDVLTFSAVNNLFKEGSWFFEHYASNVVWTIVNNSFDNCSLLNESEYPYTVHHNGYINVPFTYWQLTNSTDVILTNFTYETGPLGSYYQAAGSAFANAGSGSASNFPLYHFTTLTNQVKETNSTVDIGFHYLAVNGSTHPLDSDGDTISDYLEDSNGNGMRDSAETDFGLADTDYDGRSEGQELSEGTDPLNPVSMTPVRLGYWKFDTTNWMGQAGQLPLVTYGVTQVSSWSSNAVEIGTNAFSGLRYREVEVNGAANINCQNGTVRFWFKPNWHSTSNGVTGGPRIWAKLIEIGSYADPSGWWSLGLDPNGNSIAFVTETNGVFDYLLSASISWRSNEWYQIAFTYSRTNCAIYIDGVPVATNEVSGVAMYPDALSREYGFSLGNDMYATNQVNGSFDELETFNHPLTADVPNLMPSDCLVAVSG